MGRAGACSARIFRPSTRARVSSTAISVSILCLAQMERVPDPLMITVAPRASAERATASSACPDALPGLTANRVVWVAQLGGRSAHYAIDHHKHSVCVFAQYLHGADSARICPSSRRISDTEADIVSIAEC
jgi:hypothetical protein